MEFGERLKELRIENDVTQEELAEHLKVQRPAISGYETKGKQPDYERLILIADFFNVSIDYLLGRTEFPRYEDKRSSTSRNSHNINFADIVDFLTPRQLRLLTYYNALTPFGQGALLERAKVLYEEQEAEEGANQSKQTNKKNR